MSWFSALCPGHVLCMPQHTQNDWQCLARLQAKANNSKADNNCFESSPCALDSGVPTYLQS
eukprot:5265965-Amphidinium_carterae.1